MGIVTDQPGVVQASAGLWECLGSILGTLERTVGFDEGVVMSFDPDVLLPNAFAVTVERSLDDALLACRNEQVDEDFLKFRDLAGAPSRVGVAARESDRARSSPRWREILDVRGHGHELRAAMVDGSGQCWGALSFQREARRPFTDRDIRRVESGLERSAVAIARSMVAGSVSAANSPEPGSVWLDETGGIVMVSPAGQQWLDLLDARSHPGFGQALLVGLAMRTRQHPRAPAHAIAVRARTPDGRWVRARAESLAGRSGHGVVVVIDAARAGAILPLAASAHRLTTRELEVVRGVLNGLDTRSVAASLHIAEYTVQDHLKSVFDKVGVRSRRELAHQLAVRFG
jgi:DNA-binding CsgD family transcriptional regulator